MSPGRLITDGESQEDGKTGRRELGLHRVSTRRAPFFLPSSRLSRLPVFLWIPSAIPLTPVHPVSYPVEEMAKKKAPKAPPAPKATAKVKASHVPPRGPERQVSPPPPAPPASEERI